MFSLDSRFSGLKIWLIKELHGKYVVGLAAEKFECTNQFTQKLH